ncbi:hypothetical protein VH1709_contig00003-0001 [Vibrio harveyi]|nr:hypothetical protein VH1709_contig00003-0001 [Vibrio harveyi]
MHRDQYYLFGFWVYLGAAGYDWSEVTYSVLSGLVTSLSTSGLMVISMMGSGLLMDFCA